MPLNLPMWINENKIEGERRERILVQRGETSYFIRVLKMLADSEAMLVIPWSEFSELLNRSTRNEETPGISTKTLRILTRSYILFLSLIKIIRVWLVLRNVFEMMREVEDTTSIIGPSSEAKVTHRMNRYFPRSRFQT